jgi:hypothetical protein
MAFTSDCEEGVKAAIASIPQIASQIAALPIERRGAALRLVQQAYFRTLQQSGLEGKQLQEWVTALMGQLRMKVAETQLTKKKLKALHAELSDWLQTASAQPQD